MPKQHLIATWNTVTDRWETEEVDIFGHSVAYSETLPKSGTTRRGQLFELPTSVPPTTAPEYSSSHGPVFSTPDTMPDAPDSGSNMKSRPPGLGNQAKALPTPKASDGVMGRPRTTGRPIEKSTHLGTIVSLLPTPDANMGERGAATSTSKTRPSGHPRQIKLNDIPNLLPKIGGASTRPLFDGGNKS